MDFFYQDPDLPVQTTPESAANFVPQKRQRKNKIPDAGSSKKSKSSSDTSSQSPSVIGVTRSISACFRCRMRKTRCDQRFPSCSSCLKANVECVGIDAATGREIPRSYVSHLEDRVAYLELQLQKHGVVYDEQTSSLLSEPSIFKSQPNTFSSEPISLKPDPDNRKVEIDNMMSGVKLVSVRAASIPPSSYLGSSSGLSFARLLFTAVKFQSPTNTPNPSTKNNSTSPTDNPAAPERVQPASLPPKQVAEQLISIFFELANSQLPVLHREQFLVKYFKPIYGTISSNVSLASEYTSIGVPVCNPSDEIDENTYYSKHYLNPSFFQPDNSKCNSHSSFSSTKNVHLRPINLNSVSRSIPKTVNPAESRPSLYFLNIIFGIATSAHHQNYPAHISESFRLAAMTHVDSVFSSQNRLEALQGILLLALYSIMRPAVPGIWYVLGSAMRLCIDLGLHNESGSTTTRTSAKTFSRDSDLLSTSNAHLHNRSDYDPATLDLRRRLFWCTYSLDRQVCVYLGRPVGIPDYCVKVPFPSELDDALIVDPSFGTPSNKITDYSLEKSTSSSYKTISLMFFKIRRIQSEIQRILYDCAQLGREFSSLDEWRAVMAIKLENWHNECPKSRKRMNCNFNLGFIELNYYQTRLLLFGLCPADTSPTSLQGYLIIAESGEQVIKKYHELHKNKCINYTWVAVHNLFMAGTSYLYALYHSPEVQSNTTIEEIEFNTTACTGILSSMIDRCDAALSCRDTFKILTEAILKLWYNEKEGIVMQFAACQHAGKGESKTLTTSSEFVSMKRFPEDYQPEPHFNSNSSNPALNHIEIKNELKSSASNLSQSVPTDFSSNKHQQNSTHYDSNRPNHIWPEYLDSFFQKAAQVPEDGVSPNSDASGMAYPPYTSYNQSIASHDDESFKEVSNVSSSVPAQFGISGTDTQSDQDHQNFNQHNQHSFYNTTQNYSGESDLQHNIQNNLLPSLSNPDYFRRQLRHQQPQSSHRSDGQRIYDLLTEVPTTAIWDQFFVPTNNSNSSALNPTAMVKSSNIPYLYNQQHLQQTPIAKKMANHTININQDKNIPTCYSGNISTNHYPSN
jgi:hypothetical protein